MIARSANFIIQQAVKRAAGQRQNTSKVGSKENSQGKKIGSKDSSRTLVQRKASRRKEISMTKHSNRKQTRNCCKREQTKQLQGSHASND